MHCSCTAKGDLAPQDTGFFDTTETGELRSRLSSDTSSLQKLLTTDTVGAVRGLMMVTGGLSMMIAISPPLCAVAAVTFPAAVGLMRWAGGEVRVGGSAHVATHAHAHVRTTTLTAFPRMLGCFVLPLPTYPPPSPPRQAP